MYRRVEKHFPDGSLLQVVWRGLQEQLIAVHSRYSSLIDKCYPDSQVKLLFTVADMCQLLSEIAMKH